MKNKSGLKRVLTFILSMVVMCALCIPSLSVVATENTAVTSGKSAVVRIKVVFEAPNGNKYDIQSGSGFLIGETTVITCNHVTTLDNETINAAASRFGISGQEVQDRVSIHVTELRDMEIEASVVKSSTELDIAILDLDEAINGRSFLPIRQSSEVGQTEDVYALGFPAEVAMFQDANTYNSEDVTITEGKVTKLNTIGTVNYVQTSAQMKPGNSGGPLVDANGNVVGVCQMSTGDGFDSNYYYAIASGELIEILTSAGIDYPKPNGSSAATTEPTEATEVNKSELEAAINSAKKIEVKDYDEVTGMAFSDALTKAQKVYDKADATQSEVDAAVKTLTNAQSALKPASKGLSTLTLVLIIAGVAVVIIAVILIVILSSKKKKKVSSPAGAGYTPNSGFTSAPKTPQQNFAQPQQPSNAGVGAGETGVLNTGAGETTILSAGAGETTVLGGTSSGHLVRTKTNEKININTSNFILGKELSKVNYCISDNSNVSRKHAKITCHDGKTYITDLGSTNGTLINGTKAVPNQETLLNSGDKISLGNEEFTYVE